MQELISQKELDIKVKTLAKQITNEHRGEGTPVVFIGLLNGCFMFYSDLIKNIKLDVECDFMRVKSYIGKKKQGDIQITKDLEIPIKGKHVYLVDDIYDTGNTMNAVINYLKVKSPASLSIVTLLTRASSPIPEEPSYHAITIDDEWVVGYGLDNDKGYCRNYPTVHSV